MAKYFAVVDVFNMETAMPEAPVLSLAAASPGLATLSALNYCRSIRWAGTSGTARPGLHTQGRRTSDHRGGRAGVQGPSNDATAKSLADLFRDNVRKSESNVGAEINAGGPV